MKVFTTKEILDDLNDSIKTKRSFGLIRLGDGGLKYIQSVLTNNKIQTKIICEKEGIPFECSKDILTLWKSSINTVDYIDTPQVYFEHKFWPRTRGSGKELKIPTRNLLLSWKKIYQSALINNRNYCNPEVNFLMCLTNQQSLIEIIKGKKICCITNHKSLINVLTNCNLDILEIPGFYENQFTHFLSTIEFIRNNYDKYDLWLISCGELGRIYPGIIKFLGGRSIDIGSLVDYWCTGEVPIRLQTYMKKSKNKLKLSLTEEGKKFEEFI